MASAGVFDENDLLSLAPPALQRALLKVPDDLIAQALAEAPVAVTARILENLSPRRAAAVRGTARRLLDSRELGPRSAQAALRNLVRRVFEIAAPEVDGREASRSVGPARGAADVGVPAGKRESGPEPPFDKAHGPEFVERQPGPDLTPSAFVRLREARAAFDAARRISPFVQGIESAKLGANAAILTRTWLRRPPRQPRFS